MDLLFDWGKSDTLPYCFSIKAIIKDASGNIIGARFVKENSGIIIDVPFGALRRAFLENSLLDIALLKEERLRNTLNSGLFNQATFSPWYSPICSINFYTNFTPISDTVIFEASGFVPVDKKSLEGYTSFICSNMVIRIKDITDVTKNNLEFLNSILYETSFIKDFGISGMEQLLFVGNLGVTCKMRSYKSGDDNFNKRFKEISEKFCDKYGLPIGSLYYEQDIISISLNCKTSYCTKLKPCTIPEFKCICHRPKTDYIDLGITEHQFGSQNAVYPLPSTDFLYLCGLKEFRGKKNFADTPELDTADNIMGFSPQTFRRYVKLDNDTYLVLLGCVASVPESTVGGMEAMLASIFTSKYVQPLDDCIKKVEPIDVIIEVESSDKKRVCVSKDVEIYADAYGENHEDELKDIIATGFTKILDNMSLSGSCQVDPKSSTIKFSLTNII